MPTSNDAGSADTTGLPQGAPPADDTDIATLLPILSKAAKDPELRRRLKQSTEFAGLIGQEGWDLAQKLRANDTEESARKAQETAQAELLELAQRDPEAFAARYLTDSQKAKTQAEVTQMRNSVIQEYGTKVGRVIQAIPEFASLTPEDNQRIMAALHGLPVEDVVPAYTAVAIDVLADKKAAARLEKYRAEELPKEAKALAAENAAKVRARQTSPGTKAGTQTAADPEPDWQKEPDAWTAWYERRNPGARRTARPVSARR